MYFPETSLALCHSSRITSNNSRIHHILDDDLFWERDTQRNLDVTFTADRARGLESRRSVKCRETSEELRHGTSRGRLYM